MSLPSQEPDFDGLHVAAFESRRADDLARLIERNHGIAHVSPSMREVALDENQASIDFANRIITGEVDVFIVMTGVGFKHLIRAIERHVDMQRFLNCLQDMTTVARGPKPVVAMKEFGITPTIKVPSPNTWREILSTLDQQLPVNQLTIAIQEYGKPNPSLVAGLEARGAHIQAIKVYRWDLPEDTKPLEQNIRAIVAGEIDVLMFTSAHQLTNLFALAGKLDLENQLKSQFDTCVVVSIGPTTSEWMRHLSLPVDLEPESPKMGPMVVAAARKSKELQKRKKRIRHMLSGPSSDVLDTNAPWYDSPFMKACRGEQTDVTPVWLMRQAGRYMKEYRDIRNQTTFLELCKRPDLCAEIMVTAVTKLGVDAAIIFSDLLPILEPMGLDLEFAKGEGPVIHNPIREVKDIDRVMELESVESLDFVMETVKQTRLELPADMPLIGFSGAPFTLASYAIEGGSSRNYLNTKTIMYRDEGAWRELMLRFVRAITRYLNAQIAAGAQCVQLFDSWAGCLGTDDYRRYVLPYIQEIISGLTPGVPVINFATGNPALLPLLAEAGTRVVGVDWRVRLDDAWDTIGHDRAVQGNLDPLVLLADRDTIRSRVQDVLDQAGDRPGHIFNLGHGVLQQTPVENAIALVDAVHELSSK
ncbi:MAG: uroporphyrinogen decarboxylase [Planctomycetaceae bacterium]|tara:strand:+ start:889 stop:2820 length:1932 start_codon:yes stop_codon:yes gene_type:complete